MQSKYIPHYYQIIIQSFVIWHFSLKMKQFYTFDQWMNGKHTWTWTWFTFFPRVVIVNNNGSTYAFAGGNIFSRMIFHYKLCNHTYTHIKQNNDFLFLTDFFMGKIQTCNKFQSAYNCLRSIHASTQQDLFSSTHTTWYQIFCYCVNF